MTAITVPSAGRCRRRRPRQRLVHDRRAPTAPRPRSRGRGMHGPAGFGGPLRPRPARRPRRHPRRDPDAPRRGADARLPDHPGDLGAQRRQLDAEPRLGLPDAPAARGRGPDRARRLRVRPARLRADRGGPHGERAPTGASAPWEEAVDEVDADLVELRDLVHQVLAATRQVAQAGTAAQVKAAQDVLRTARKSIYRLLAEDESEADARLARGRLIRA